MRVFITGIAGFLGSHVAEDLLSRGHEVSGNDHFKGGYADNVPSGATCHEADCCDFDRMRALLEGVDVVVHAAAAAYEGFSVFSPALVTRDNSQASATVFSAAAATGVQRVVFCSSMSRYGDSEVPFHEKQPVRPCDPYAISKVASEQLLTHLAGVHGFEHAIAIPHNIIGARQKYDDPYRNVASIMANLMLQDRQPIIYGDGEQMRCFSPVQDVVGCLTRLVLDPDVDGLVVNVGPDDGFITINALAKEVAAVVGFDGLDPLYVDPRPCEVKLATCSSDLARTRLGFEPTRTLRDGLEDIVAYIRRRGPRPFEYHLPLEIVTDATPKTWKDRLF